MTSPNHADFTAEQLHQLISVSDGHRNLDFANLHFYSMNLLNFLLTPALVTSLKSKSNAFDAQGQWFTIIGSPLPTAIKSFSSMERDQILLENGRYIIDSLSNAGFNVNYLVKNMEEDSSQIPALNGEFDNRNVQTVKRTMSFDIVTLYTFLRQMRRGKKNSSQVNNQLLNQYLKNVVGIDVTDEAIKRLAFADYYSTQFHQSVNLLFSQRTRDENGQRVSMDLRKMPDSRFSKIVEKSLTWYRGIEHPTEEDKRFLSDLNAAQRLHN